MIMRWIFKGFFEEAVGMRKKIWLFCWFGRWSRMVNERAGRKGVPFWVQDGLATKRNSPSWKQFFIPEWNERYGVISNRVIFLLEVSKWGRLRSLEWRTATHLRVAFLARSPEREKWAPFLTLTLRDSQIWGTRFDRWMPWNEKCPLFLTLDLVENMIWGVKLGYRPPGRVIWGSFLHHRPVRHPNLGIILVSSTSRKANLGGQIGPATSRKANLGGQIGPATSRRSNLGGRIRLFTCFTPKTFTHYLIVEGIGTPIFFENKGIDLLDSLSKGARFETRVGREWKQEHMFEVLKAWKWKEALRPPSS